jgi:hypothetical protein
MGAVVVSVRAKRLRKELRPLVWATLEEVALDSVFENGRFVARTSARLIADRLGVGPGTPAGALRALRQRGLLTFERESGPAGRFGLSMYVPGDVSGLKVVSCADCPHLAAAWPGEPDNGSPELASTSTEEPCVAEPRMVEEPLPELSTSLRFGSSTETSSRYAGQGTLDLREGIA